MLPSNLEAELLRPGEVTVLAGRPGQGKTSLALQLAMNAVGRNDSAVVFSLKTPKARLLKRLLCLETRIPLTAAMSDEIPQADQQKAAGVLKRLSKSPLHIIDSASSVKEIVLLSKRLSDDAKSARRPLGLIVVDYLQLVSEMLDNGDTRNVMAVARTFNGLARELNVPILLMSVAKRRVIAMGVLERDINRVVLTVTRPRSRDKKIRLKFDPRTGSLSKP